MDTSAIYKPVLVAANEEQREGLFAEHKVQEWFDNFQEQALEYYEVMHPRESHAGDQEHKAAFMQREFGDNLDQAGVWAIFPWMYKAIRIVPEVPFRTLRTARNKYIITEEEQQKFYDGVVGIAGMSVGSSIATILALTGGPKHIRLADFDTLALTNLNRINNSVASLGLNKAVICARRIFELNPFAEVEIFTEGITSENITRFTEGLTVLFDEIDNLKLKIDLRLHARDAKIPVVMITDNADNIMIDIERFDQGVTSLFHGRLEEREAQELFAAPTLHPAQRMEATLKIVGAENGTPRMQHSLLEVGKTLPSWPQIGTATTLTGAAGAYIARKIILGEPLFSGRTHLSLDSVLIPDYTSPETEAERNRLTAEFVEALSKR